MLLRYCFILLISLSFVVALSNNLVTAESTNSIPSWVKIIGDWWLEGSITDIQFLHILIFLMGDNVAITEEENNEIPNTTVTSKSETDKFIIHYMTIEDYEEESNPGRISPLDPFSEDITPKKIESWLRQTQYFEKQVAKLNMNLDLPSYTYIGLGECQEENSHYNKNTKMISICYELIYDIYDKFLKEYKSKGFTEKEISIMTLNLVDYIFYHQIGHMVIELESKIENQETTTEEEILADSIANHIKTAINQNTKHSNVIGLSQWFKIMNQIENIEPTHMWNTHELDYERLSKMACEVSSLNSNMTKDFIQKGLFSKEKLVECKIENLKQKAIVKEMTMQILK